MHVKCPVLTTYTQGRIYIWASMGCSSGGAQDLRGPHHLNKIFFYRHGGWGRGLLRPIWVSVSQKHINMRWKNCLLLQVGLIGGSLKQSLIVR